MNHKSKEICLLRIRGFDFWVYPCSLVVWVVNLWWFPFSVHFIIPIIGFGGISIGNVFWFVPVFWFGVFWVVHLCIIYPVFWFLCFWILDLLCWKHIPVFF